MGAPQALGPDEMLERRELLQVNQAQVKKTVLKIKEDKSSSIPNIKTRVIKDCFKNMTTVPTRMVNTCIATQTVPNQWKVGTVVPLPKAGRSSDVGNWRPICLLDVCNKMTEKIIHQQLLAHLMQGNRLSKYQNGFVPGRSTQDAINDLVMDMYTARNRNHRSAESSSI